MKIKEIEEIVIKNIEKREKEIGRQFTQKEKAIAILNEQLKLMEFDPGFAWSVRNADEYQKEMLEKIKEPDLGEVEVDKYGTCKMLSVVYKYIADRNGLNVILHGKEYRADDMYYSKISELIASSTFEHIYAVVKNGYEELKIDVQDEAQALKRKSKPRNLGGRQGWGLYIQETTEIDPILVTIGYKKEDEEYSDVYVKNKIKELEQSTKSEYEIIKMILEDEYLQKCLKNSGVISSYKFYKEYIKKGIEKVSKVVSAQEKSHYVLPCYIKREANGKEQISYSYILYVDCEGKKEIYMYSDAQGELVETTPELVKQMIDANLHIGHGELVREDEEVIYGRGKLIKYINAKVEPNKSQGEEK